MRKAHSMLAAMAAMAMASPAGAQSSEDERCAVSVIEQISDNAAPARLNRNEDGTTTYSVARSFGTGTFSSEIEITPEGPIIRTVISSPSFGRAAAFLSPIEGPNSSYYAGTDPDIGDDLVDEVIDVAIIMTDRLIERMEQCQDWAPRYAALERAGPRAFAG